MIDNSSAQSINDSQVLLAQLATEFLREKKRQQRRKWYKGIVWLLVVCWGAYLYFALGSEQKKESKQPHVGLIDINGNIFENEIANAENFSKSMDKAYASKAMKALIIRIDSSGGSPVQADYMYNTIQYYRKKHDKIKVYAVCVDVCASAAYYVAAAADEIYASPASIVGSIGVLYNGFGFVDAMQKLGVSRRLQTAGVNKGFMDQFSPVVPGQEKILQTMLDLIHQDFINKVKAGRGNRLKLDDETFSGLFWTGIQAKERGLIDGFASSGQLMRETIKLKNMVDYSYKEMTIERVAKRMGVAMINQLPAMLGLKVGFQ